MKIAIIQPRASYHVAGSEKVSFKHAEHLARLGHTVNFYTSKVEKNNNSFLFKDFLSKEGGNVKIFQFDITKLIPDIYRQKPDINHNRWVTESFAFNEMIYKNILQNKPDVVLSYYLPDGLFKPSNVCNVLYLAGYPSNPVPWYTACVPFFDATIAISKEVSRQWKENIGVGKKHFVLGTGVEYPVTLKETIEPKAGFNLVFAGRLLERKGLLTLIDAFSRVVEKNEGVHLWILGDGDLQAIVKEKIERLMISDHVTMTGVVENPQDYFNMADICIFPSHQGDGLMGTVLESMAIGKPVISTRRNGNEDIIVSGKNGILVEPKNSRTLASAIEDVIGDQKKRLTLGRNAEVFIKKNVTWKKNVFKLNRLLKEIGGVSYQNL